MAAVTFGARASARPAVPACSATRPGRRVRRIRGARQPFLTTLKPRPSREGARGRAAGGGDAATPDASLQPELRRAIDEFVNGNKVVLFMKGTKQFPQCGFSNTCVMILNELLEGIRSNSGATASTNSGAGGVPPIDYETVNVLDDDSLRSGMKLYSSWPTFPQLYVGGEFVGMCYRFAAGLSRAHSATCAAKCVMSPAELVSWNDAFCVCACVCVRRWL